MMPPYISAIAWIVLANPSNGILNKLLGTSSIFNIYSLGGLVFVETSYYYTFVLLNLLQAMDRIDPALEEAARISGASGLKVFSSVTLPLIAPSLFSGVLLVFLATAASFGVPAMIGTPAGIYLLTTRIYTFQRMGTLNGTQQSVVLAVLLLLLAILILAITLWSGKKNQAKVVSGKASRPSLIPLRSARPWITCVLAIIFIILFGLPFLGTLMAALSKVQGVFTFDNFGFENFRRVFFDVDETPRAFWNSLTISFAAATITAILGFFISYMMVKGKKVFSWPIEMATTLPYATPGTVLALGLMLAVTLFGATKFLYLTPALIVMAYVAKYLSFSLRTCNDGFEQLHDSLAEAARVSGATPAKVISSIWLPLLRTSLMAGWFLVFMPSFSELTMTILLTGPGLETVGTLLFQLQEYGDSSGGGACVLAILLIIFVATVNFIIKIISKGRYGL
jgi:iron(III) transport system permease protein